MNRFLIIILLIGQLLPGVNKEVKAKLKQVKLYTGAAEFQHEFTLNLEQGYNTIRVTGLANNFDENSIQAGLRGEAVLLTVNKDIDYLKGKIENEEFQKLDQKKSLLEENIKKMNNEIEVLQSQENLLMNTKPGGDGVKLTVKEIKEYLDFANDKMLSVKSKKLDILGQKTKIEKELQLVNQQIAALNQKNFPANQIELEVFAKKNTSADFSITYNSWNAGWNMSYRINAENLKSPLTVEYYAQINQNSGLDWEGIDFTLSTMQPSTGNKPELNPWFIDFYEEPAKLRLMKSQAVMDQVQQSNLEFQSVAAAPKLENVYNITNSVLAAEFKPEIKYNIPSDGKNHLVKLNEIKIEAEYEYYCAPKLSRDVFLVANIKKWRDANLVPGEAKIYLENTFVGSTYINSEITDDELLIALGKDRNITVDYKRVKDFQEDKFLSSNVERFFNYEIKIRNNRKDKISITIEDNIPISQNENIVVELITPGTSKVNNETGVLSWKKEIDSGKELKETYRYSVKYPGNKKINNLN